MDAAVQTVGEVEEKVKTNRGLKTVFSCTVTRPFDLKTAGTRVFTTIIDNVLALIDEVGKMAYSSRTETRTRIASGYEVWRLVVMFLRWWRVRLGRNAFRDSKHNKCHQK